MKYMDKPKEFFICLKGTITVLRPRKIKDINLELAAIRWIQEMAGVSLHPQEEEEGAEEPKYEVLSKDLNKLKASTSEDNPNYDYLDFYSRITLERVFYTDSYF